MRFRSVADLNQDILRNLHRIPPDIEAIVGIPRSGILPAALLSLCLNLPLADVEGFCAGRLLASGRTKKHAGLDRSLADMKHVLLVDDSINTGISMRSAQHLLQTARPDLRVTTFAAYGIDSEMKAADIVLAIAEKPRVFQWNVMHHKILESSCVDIDGILCPDPTSSENDDGPAYLRFLNESTPLHRPTRRIHALVTSRLEKYRKETEAWLAKSGIAYDQLVMLDLSDAATRRRNHAHGAFKAAYYKSSGASLFVESEPAQAQEIATQSRKPVLWLPGAEMIYPDRRAPLDPSRTIGRRSGRIVKRILRGMVGESVYAELRRDLRNPFDARSHVPPPSSSRGKR
jgi:uncharacterized HAD superfamily protein